MFHTSSWKYVILILVFYGCVPRSNTIQITKRQGRTEKAVPHKSIGNLKTRAPTEIRAELQANYYKYVGVREQGSNKGEMVEKFLSNLGLPAGLPWCATYVVYNFDELAIEHNMDGRARSCCVSSVITKSPEIGDVVGFDFTTNGAIDHTGFFDGTQGDDLILTVEGNTTNPNDRREEGVYKKIRRYDFVVSFGNWIDQ